LPESGSLGKIAVVMASIWGMSAKDPRIRGGADPMKPGLRKIWLHALILGTSIGSRAFTVSCSP
jgi:hypothetical protein